MKRILIIDDDPDIVELIKKRLEANDYKVETSEEGFSGLEAIRRNPPDLIILDVMMPKLDGFHLCRMVKFDERFGHIPIILLTARHKKEDKQIGEEVNADVYITKPFDSDQLLLAVKKLLESGAEEAK